MRGKGAREVSGRAWRDVGVDLGFSVGATDLHLVLEVITQNAVELLDVVLHERVDDIPAERLGQLRCACVACTAFSGCDDEQRIACVRRQQCGMRRNAPTGSLPVCSW